MARQKSLIKLKGTLDGITFYKSKKGYMARQSTSLDGELVATDPRFVRTRENNAEFGRAGAAGKILRKAFRDQIQLAKDGTVVSRLSKEMMKVLQADKVSARGKRNVLDGELELLRGFNFNSRSPIDTVLFMNYSYEIDRAGGVLGVSFPSFRTLTSIQAPQGSTHFKIIVGGAAIDFENENTEVAVSDSGELALEALTTEAFTQQVNLSADSSDPLFLVLGIIFYQEVNGFYYHLSNGVFNSLAIIGVEGI